MGGGRDRQPLPCPSVEDTLAVKCLTSASQSLGVFQEGASLAALSVHFQFHLEKRHGELPPPWCHTDPRDLFLPVQSEHVSAVSCGAGLPVLAAWHSSPRAWPRWKQRQKRDRSVNPLQEKTTSPFQDPCPQTARHGRLDESGVHLPKQHRQSEASSRQISGLATHAWPLSFPQTRPAQSPPCLVGWQGAPSGATQWLQPQSGGLSHQSVKKAGSPGPGRRGAATFLLLVRASETSGSGNVRARPCCPPLAAVSPRSLTGFQGATKWLGKTLTAMTTLKKKLHFCRNADMRLCLGSSARPPEPLMPPVHG